VSLQARIEQKLSAALAPAHLEVINESSGHNVPPGSETHFKVVVVADAFDGEGRVARHRRVHGLLVEELAGGVHALSVKAHTPTEWTERGGAVAPSPACRGGGR
jgi:BolA protein